MATGERGGRDQTLSESALGAAGFASALERLEASESALSERRFHLGTWTWDLRADLVTWSSGLYSILGIEPGTVTPTAELFFSRLHPEDRALAEAGAEQAMREGVLPPLDCRIVRSDGSIRHATATGSCLVGAEGRGGYMVGWVLDCTANLEVEAELRGALAGLEEAQRVAQLGSWTFCPETGKVEWSAEFRRIAGFPPDLPPRLEHLLEQVVPEDRAQFVERYALAMASPRGGELDGRIKHPNGEIRHIRIKGVLAPGTGRKGPQLRGTMQDITDQVRLRERLIQSQKMEAVGRLAGGIAHDFNNLLTVVLGNLILMEPEITDAEALKDCYRALESATNLTKRLLAFGRKAQLSLKFVDPNELVNSTLSLMKRLVGGQVKLETDLAERIPMVHVDPLELERALVNLVVNARDVMPTGGTVKIGTRECQEAGASYVDISVMDEGPGISEESLPHIFEPFYTTRPGTGGTGLGLSTVLGTAEQHGGTVRVSARDGVGSVFTIRLPAVSSVVASQRDGTKTPVRSRAQGVLTFLVIDDEPSVAAVIRRLLSSREHTVHVAVNPEQALAIWAEHKNSIDLVVCDVVMPEMRGPDLIARLSESGVCPKVLFMSGYNEESAAVVQAQRVLAKPFTDSALEAAVDEALAQSVG